MGAFPLLGSGARFTVSNGMVRRVADDPNSHYSCDPDQQDSIHSKPCELALDCDVDRHSHIRGLASVFSPCAGTGTRAVAVHVLANPSADAILLHELDASIEDLAAAETLDLGTGAAASYAATVK